MHETGHVDALSSSERALACPHSAMPEHDTTATRHAWGGAREGARERGRGWGVGGGLLPARMPAPALTLSLALPGSTHHTVAKLADADDYGTAGGYEA